MLKWIFLIEKVEELLAARKYNVGIASKASNLQAQKKRKSLNIQARMKVSRYSKENPGSGYRKIAEYFEIGKAQAQKIFKIKMS